MTAPEATSITLDLDEHVAASAQREVAAFLQAGELDADVVADVLSLLTELVTDLSRQEAGRAITLDVAVSVEGVVTITLTGGRWELAQTLVDPPRPTGPPSGMGRGVFILDSLAQSWGASRSEGTTSLWFTMPIGEAGGRQDPWAPAAASLPADPAAIAAQAAVTAERAAVAAATRTADAAQDARVSAAAAAIAAAAEVAEAAANTVRAVQTQADELAEAVATAAEEAAATVLKSIVAGGDAEAALVAQRIGATVLATAMAKAEDTARAAVLVARAVSAAASAVAITTAAAAAELEGEVLQAARAVRAVTAAAAKQLAADTVERAAVTAAADHRAAVATQRLHDANRLLTQTGLHDRQVALALQAAMLTRLPERDDIVLTSRYLTAALEDQVGGDWYDAIPTPHGRTTLVIGDVIGHDIHAAAVMGQLRNILRGQILERHHPPSHAVTRLDRANRDLSIQTLATLVVVNIEPNPLEDPVNVATLHWSNAGHPPPVLIHADGGTTQLDYAGDLLLGVRPDSIRQDHSCPVPPGATLLLYTDGLIETRTHSLDHGLHRLTEAIGAHHHLDTGAMLDGILAEMVGEHPHDDVAVLAVDFPSSDVGVLSAVR